MKEFNYPNMIIRVHSPELTPEERSKRMESIKRASGDVLKERRKNGN